MMTVRDILAAVADLHPSTPIEANVNGHISTIIDIDDAADDGNVLTIYVELGRNAVG